MINGFEQETAELNEYELNVLMPVVAKGLAAHVGKDREVAGSHICERLNGAGYRIDGPRLRKVVNYIRIKGIVKCLIATGNGYYVATSKQEVEKFIEGLRGRGAAIFAVADAMDRQVQCFVFRD